MDNPEAAILAEQGYLRAEAQELKRCQLQYFLLSVGGAGAVFAFGGSDHAEFEMLSSLSALAIVIPCWWTFFDKATTLTRLVGYTRVWLERELREDEPFYHGYEDALYRFRIHEDSVRDLKDKIEQESQGYVTVPAREFRRWAAVLAFRTRHRYWVVNWWAFFSLSSAALALPLLRGADLADEKLVTYMISLSAVLLSALYTLRILVSLCEGRFSYRNVTTLWSNVRLRSPE